MLLQGEEAGDEEDEEEDSQQSELDPYELIDPVDIISKLPKNFFELIEEKKWQLRKEALDALLPLAQSPKLQPGDYHELVKALKKVISKVRPLDAYLANWISEAQSSEGRGYYCFMN